MLPLSYILLWPAVALASVILHDPSDVISPNEWTEDNDLIADYNVPLPSVQPRDLEAAHDVKGEAVEVDHAIWSTESNDTSIVLVANEADFVATYSKFVKHGYSSNLNWASFWGFNAAINVANASTARLDHVNITVHNGAANVYAYGTDTVVNVTNSWLYSSGPVSHGLYASGNGTIRGRNIAHYSGGKRSSAFSGDGPAGYIYVDDSVSHCRGIGSATFYALGEIHANHVVSVSEMGPVVFSDGQQKTYIRNSQAQAGYLAGTVLFSSSVRSAGAVLELENTRITTTGDDMAALWFGNVIASAKLTNVELVTASNILAVANYSQVTQDFTYFGGYADNSAMQPAEVDIAVAESTLSGDIVAYNESSIALSLRKHSSWSGTTSVGYGKAYFGVALDASSNWTLTSDATLQNFTDHDHSLRNIHSQGHDLYYNASAPSNSWLDGRTIGLQGGGSAQPYR